VLVSPGTYPSFVLDQAVRVVASGTGKVTIRASGQEPAFLVTGIAFGEAAMVSGVTVTRGTCSGPATPLVVVEQCTGSVTLHDVVSTPTCRFSDPALEIRTSDQVLLDSLSVRGFAAAKNAAAGGRALVVQQSSVWLVDCDIEGGAASQSTGSGFPVPAPGRPGLSSDGSEVLMARSVVRGGRGLTWTVTLPVTCGNGGAAIEADSSTLLVAGGPGNLLEGGAAGGSGGLLGVGGNALFLAGGTSADLGADVVLSGGFGQAFPVQGPAEAVFADASSSSFSWPVALPTVGGAATAPLGTIYGVELSGNPFALQAVFLDMRQGAWPSLPGVPGKWPLSSSPVLLTVLQIPAPGTTTLGLFVPPDPVLHGMGFYLAAFEVSAFSLALANPSYAGIVP
jgi:hypothetical protein